MGRFCQLSEVRITFMRLYYSYHHTFLEILEKLAILLIVMYYNRILRIAETVMLLKRRAVVETLNFHQIVT